MNGTVKERNGRDEKAVFGCVAAWIRGLKAFVGPSTGGGHAGTHTH